MIVAPTSLEPVASKEVVLPGAASMALSLATGTAGRGIGAVWSEPPSVVTLPPTFVNFPLAATENAWILPPLSGWT